MTAPHMSAPEHSTASLGAVVAAGVVLVGLLVGLALGVGEVVDLVAWMFGRQ
ncbi:hypothetical protein [Cellulomonas fimi]|uniref:Uncharacterized protein n=1 Tax=Cellulomonas fimi (strain ATCC 484 / DSM 20113 / JCM 1341 / CCUG 24087 / LMG 16345 / NBRC 15513 / NCIMB 8980 / NCTC 7547 / NRS-133) TaxID=590998 RepID=F4H189_CELFA|nr:hypothetical protein [Cellulomonas fimi]AEE45060.1 hypothetical protein Celf_0923 [Cellulomonas fimi ATCC 484]NNH07965.1 hypothetical protein [Cellulomonas fimi]VEH28118.1 Uncharacterised protein [Cellulomonas fimi]